MSGPEGLRIVPLDVGDDAALAAFHAAYLEGQCEGLGDLATTWMLPELRETLRRPNRRRVQECFVAVLDGPGGAVVGTGFLGRPMMDNLDAAQVALDVVPAHRRRGIGSVLLQHLEDAARAHGRSLLDAEVVWPHELGSDGTGWAGREFALARGYRLALGDVQRELALPVAEALLEELAAEAAPHHADFELRSWVGDIPEEIAHSWMTLSSSLMTEAPTGEREVEPEVVDVAALREGEATVRAQGRTRFNTVALDAAGDVVGYTDLVTTRHEPGRAYQWGTLVRRDARGHRLGLAVKVANLRLLQATDPSVRRLTTYNAEVNAHMIGVNERLGFRPVARLGEFQKRLS